MTARCLTGKTMSRQGDANAPEYDIAVYECMEAFRHLTRKGGDEMSNTALDAFGASLHVYTVKQVNALSARFQQHTAALPASKL